MFWAKALGLALFIFYIGAIKLIFFVVSLVKLKIRQVTVIKAIKTKM